MVFNAWEMPTLCVVLKDWKNDWLTLIDKLGTRLRSIREKLDKSMKRCRKMVSKS